MRRSPRCQRKTAALANTPLGLPTSSRGLRRPVGCWAVVVAAATVATVAVASAGAADHTAVSTATITGGPLTVSPSLALPIATGTTPTTLQAGEQGYRLAADGATVTVIDATGTGAGWTVDAVATATGADGRRVAVPSGTRVVVTQVTVACGANSSCLPPTFSVGLPVSIPVGGGDAARPLFAAAEGFGNGHGQVQRAPRLAGTPERRPGPVRTDRRVVGANGRPTRRLGLSAAGPARCLQPRLLRTRWVTFRKRGR